MVDNTAAKSHLTSVETTLTDMRNLDNITNLINVTSLRLFDVLGGQNLLVDQAIKDGLLRIREDLQGTGGGGGGTHLGHRVQQKIAELDAERTLINPGGKNAARVAEIGREINSLHNIASNTGVVTTNVTNRHNEYDALYAAANRFKLDKTLDDLNINITALPRTGTTNIPIQNRFISGTDYPSYELCDDKGDKLTRVGSNYQVVVGSQTYTLGGIRFTTTHPVRLDCSNITINPTPAALPLNIKLSVNASYPVNVGLNTINVTCNKKLNLTLNDGTIKVDTDASRGTAFDDYENSGGRHAISEQLNTKINVRDNNPEVGKNIMERKAIEMALKYKGGTKYDTLSEAQKRLFYERVCRAGFFTTVYTAGGIIDTGAARLGKMRDWFTHGSRSWNNDNSIIGSASAYKTYIHSHLDEKCDEYILDTLQNYLQEDTRNTALKAELSRFLQEIDNNKLDDNLNTVIGGNLDRNNARRLYRMDRGPRSPFQNRDTNYMRFFAGSSTELKNQKVNIYTRLGEAEPMKYNLKMNISGKNNIVAEIKIDGVKDPIRLSSGEPTSLVRRVLREQRIKYGKARAHIGYNIYKAMIQLAKEKNFSLQYRRRDGTRFIDLDGDNIVVRRVRNLTTMNRDDDIISFDQQKFEDSNRFGGLNDNALEQGLLEIGRHFNLAMNQVHRQYRRGVEKKFGTLINSRSKMRLPTSFWFSPIKKILNRKDVTDFDFDTTVNSNGKRININFAKNKFTINMEGLDKPIESGDLGKILNKRQKKTRIFDGMERDMLEGIYIALVNKLRENGKIASTDFGVRDDITGNMYVLNRDGRFGMIPREDLESQGNPMIGPRWKESGILNHQRLDRSGLVLFEKGSTEEKELLKNPFLMQKFMKTMNRRMGLGGSIAAMFN